MRNSRQLSVISCQNPSLNTRVYDHPFDLKTVATTTDDEQGIISTVYVDVIQILTSPQALADTEMQGTITMIAECGGFGGDGIDEF